jgi:hypothetical protein
MAAAPDARVLLTLRDPVARFRSGLQLQLKRGMSPSDATLDAFHRGLYAGQVAQLLTCVPRAQVMIVLYEEARDAPDETRARMAEFVGLDPARFSAPVQVRTDSSVATAPRGLAAPLLETVTDRYREDSARLAALLPELDLDRWTLQPR